MLMDKVHIIEHGRVPHLTNTMASCSVPVKSRTNALHLRSVSRALAGTLR